MRHSLNERTVFVIISHLSHPDLTVGNNHQNGKRADSISIRLLRLPKELRLTIYDTLLEPLIDQGDVPDTYAFPDEWPKIDLSAYTNLVASCKQLHSEVKAHFEKCYLPGLTIFFDNTPQLYKFDQAACTFGAPYQDIQFSLRTTNRYSVSDISNKIWHIDEDSAKLMMLHPGFDPRFDGAVTWALPKCTRLKERERALFGKGR